MPDKFSFALPALFNVIWLIWKCQLCMALSDPSIDLSGRTLRCCTALEEPVVFRDPAKKRQSGFDGIAMDYLDTLQARLNFTCSSVTLFKDDITGATGFTDFIKHLAECSENGRIKNLTHCKCDIGVGGWMKNSERVKLVDYLPAFTFDEFQTFTHLRNMDTSEGDVFFLTTFDGTTWCLIFVLMGTFAFLKMLDRRFAPPDKNLKPLPSTATRLKRLRRYLLKSPILYRLRKAIQSTASRMIGQSDEECVNHYRSTRQWVLNYVIVLSGVFLILTYEASMTASLVQGIQSSDFSSVHDFKSCRVLPGDVCIPQGGAAESFWFSAIQDKEVHCHQTSPRIIPGYSSIGDAVNNGTCKFAYCMGATAGTAVNGKFCRKLFRVGESFYRSGLSFVLPKGSELLPAMSFATMQLREMDTIPSVAEYLEKRNVCGPPPNRLAFSRLKMFFVLAFAICGLIFVEMVLDPQRALQEAKEGQITAAGKTSSGSGDGSSSDITDIAV